LYHPKLGLRIGLEIDLVLDLVYGWGVAEVNIHEAKTHLSRLLNRVAAGEEIVISKAGKPIAVLGPLPKPAGTRVPGRYRGQIVIHPNFDDPIEEFEEYF